MFITKKSHHHLTRPAWDSFTIHTTVLQIKSLGKEGMKQNTFSSYYAELLYCTVMTLQKNSEEY